MTSAREAEIGIVGGGPAGCWAAYRLARAGARVVLFDHSHPREKPCGGGLTGRALQLVADAVPAAALTAEAVPIARAVFRDPRTPPATVPLISAGVSDASSLVVAGRRAFDQALLQAARDAGVTYCAERVRDVQVGADGTGIVTAGRTWQTGFVIGADGPGSLVRRRLFRPFARRQLSIATGVFAHGATSSDIVIEFVARPAGYIWSFPRPDHLAIGVCAQADETAAGPLQALARDWVARFEPARGARLEPYSWPIPSLAADDWDDEVLAGDRWALVGDAAGLVDPITREGIFFALQSADLLATALLDAHTTTGPAVPSPGVRYASALRAGIVPELQRAARLKRGFFRGPFTKLLVDALRHSRPVNEVMRDLVAGRQEYRTLKRRLLSTFELRLAWQLLALEWQGRRSRLTAQRA